MKLLATTLSMLILSATAVYAQSVYVGVPPACNTNPCTIKLDGGGNIIQYKQLGQRLKRTKEMLRIDGKCYSSCTVLADTARPYACVTPNASMHIHQGLQPTTVENNGQRSPVGYSRDIATWIDRMGGQPVVGWLDMSYETALAFWPKCQELSPPQAKG